MRPSMRLAALLTLAACGTQAREPYYKGRPPEVTGIAGDASENGNLGGSEVVIQGSRFGEDPNQVVVQFGSINAKVLSVTDSELTVLSPVGPATGGAVDIHVGTATGEAVLAGGYLYDVGDIYEGQYGFILVNNYWTSCLGGRDSIKVGTSSAGCETVSYMYPAGTTGSAAVFDFAFPRAHTDQIGWSGAVDWSYEEWSVQTPAYAPYLGGQEIENLRVDLDKLTGASDGDVAFSLHNPVLEGQDWCVDMRDEASFWFEGTAEKPATAISGDVYAILDDVWESEEMTSAEDCTSVSGRRYYDLGVLDFCELDEYQADPNVYQPDWAVPLPFFVAKGEGSDFEGRSRKESLVNQIDSCRDGEDGDADGVLDGADPDCHPEITLELPGTDADGTALRVPESVTFEVTSGLVMEGVPESAWSWANVSWEDCFGGGPVTPKDVAMRFEWSPSEVELSSGGSITQAETHVQIALTVMQLGWFGGEARPIRISTVVPDFFNVDEETGKSVLDLPVDVFYELPLVKFPDGGCTKQGNKLACEWSDPADLGFGYLFITADRVTEYRLAGGDKVGGDLVFAYATGDFGFRDWSSPLDNGACGNCEDEDGDGWVDMLDADCLVGEGGGSCTDGEDNDDDGKTDVEDNNCKESGKSDRVGTCADGDDNDGDGDIDSEDADCEDGSKLESNCDDEIDNDGDGWIDDVDAECADRDGVELGEDTAYTCNDNIDNDGDGWFDDADPACKTGQDSEEGGYGPTECNDGVDNDGHYDTDWADPSCRTATDSEQGALAAGCTNGLDDDADGFTDEFDPDCESGSREKNSSDSEGRECYDGADNDADGLTDAADPGCWNVNPDFAYTADPDGFLDDESDDGDCLDGEDNDGDTLVDLDDPGCAAGVGKAEATAD